MSHSAVIMASVDGEVLGCMDSPSRLTQAIDSVELALGEASGERVELDFDIEYSLDLVLAPDYLDEDDCAERIMELAMRERCEAYVLSLDGTAIAASEDKAELYRMIELLKARLDDASVPGELELDGELKVESRICERALLMSADEFSAGIGKEEVIYESELQVAAFEAASPYVSDEIEDAPAPSQVTFESPLADYTLGYSFVETTQVEEIDRCAVIRLEDDRLLEGMQEVIAEGENGSSIVTYKIRRDAAGIESARVELEREVLSTSKPRIVIVGTRPATEDEYTESFIWPCHPAEGVSSPYGWRDLYGRMDFHLGIDLPDDEGAAVWAADGGEVIFAGATPSYGNNVKIRHDDNTETLYAHLKKIEVKVGDVVSQGEKIGTMGHTGVAYGTHLHFEVRIDGKTVDPEKYLPAIPCAEDKLHQKATELMREYYPELFTEEDKRK